MAHATQTFSARWDADVLKRLARRSELAGTKEFINYDREAGALQLEVLATRDAALAKEALKSGRTIRELALEHGMDAAELDRLLDPAAMTEPGLGGGSAGG